MLEIVAHSLCTIMHDADIVIDKVSIRYRKVPKTTRFVTIYIRIGPNRSESVRIGPNRSELVRIGPNWSNSVRIGLNQKRFSKYIFDVAARAQQHTQPASQPASSRRSSTPPHRHTYTHAAAQRSGARLPASVQPLARGHHAPRLHGAVRIHRVRRAPVSPGGVHAALWQGTRSRSRSRSAPMRSSRLRTCFSAQRSSLSLLVPCLSLSPRSLSLALSSFLVSR